MCDSCLRELTQEWIGSSYFLKRSSSALLASQRGEIWTGQEVTRDDKNTEKTWFFLSSSIIFCMWPHVVLQPLWFFFAKTGGASVRLFWTATKKGGHTLQRSPVSPLLFPEECRNFRSRILLFDFVKLREAWTLQFFHPPRLPLLLNFLLVWLVVCPFVEPSCTKFGSYNLWIAALLWLLTLYKY